MGCVSCCFVFVLWCIEFLFCCVIVVHFFVCRLFLARVCDVLWCVEFEFVFAIVSRCVVFASLLSSVRGRVRFVLCLCSVVPC